MSLTKRGLEIEQYLQNPFVLAMLDVIADAEGANKEGYHTRFGSGRYDDLSKHPNETQSFTTKSGKKQRTTAAGRYQFINSTWNEEAKKLGLTDFGPRSQDLAAISRLKFRGALDAVARGDFAAALPKLGIEWASLPSSPYDQNKRSDKAVAAMVDKYVAARTNGEGQVTMPDGTVQDLARRVEQDVRAEDAESEQVAEAEAQTRSLEDRKAEISRIIQESINQSAVEVGLDTVESDLAAVQAAAEIDTIGGAEAVAASSTPDWVAEIPSASPLLDAPDARQFDEAWEDNLIRDAAAVDADAIRAQAQAAFLGDEYVPSKPIPRPIERAINRVVSLI